MNFSNAPWGVQSKSRELIKRKNERFSSRWIQLTIIRATSIIDSRDYKLPTVVGFRATTDCNLLRVKHGSAESSI